MSAEKLDFDPYRISGPLADWFSAATEAERDRHGAIFAQRALAAADVLRAVNLLRAACRRTEHPRLAERIRDLLEVARDLHDYDPTSD